jgi:hypothetical protein
VKAPVAVVSDFPASVCERRSAPKYPLETEDLPLVPVFFRFLCKGNQGAASWLRGLKVVEFLGMGGVHRPGLFAGCEQLQLDNVFDQAGVSRRLVVLGPDVFGSHSGDPSSNGGFPSR